MYKNLLDNQLNYNKELSGYGNMTNVEKKLNRADLTAYKNYDNRQYCLIPGVSQRKADLAGLGNFKKNANNYEESEVKKRLDAYGMSRYSSHEKLPYAAAG